MTDLLSDSRRANRNGLVGHHVGSRVQTIPCGRVDDHPKIRRVISVGGHLVDDHGRALSRQRVALHNYAGPWFAAVTGVGSMSHQPLDAGEIPQLPVLTPEIAENQFHGDCRQRSAQS